MNGNYKHFLLIFVLVGCLGATEPDSLRNERIHSALIKVLIVQQIADYSMTVNAMNHGAYEYNSIVRGRPLLFACLNIVAIVLLHHLEQTPPSPEQVKRENKILMALVGYYTIALSNNVYQEIRKAREL